MNLVTPRLALDTLTEVQEENQTQEDNNSALNGNSQKLTMNQIRQKLGLAMVKTFTERKDKKNTENHPLAQTTRSRRPLTKVSASKVMAQREWEKFEKNIYGKNSDIYGKGTFAKSSFENRHDDLPDEEEKLELHQVEVEESNKEAIESS